MSKSPSHSRADTDQRAATRIFWFGVLGAVLGTLGTFWLLRSIGLLDDIPPELDVFMIVVCLVAVLAFMFTHRNADGTIQFTRSAGATSPIKPPQGRRTALLIAATCALYWLLANVLHLSGGMLALAKILTCATIAFLCTRYVLRSRKPDVDTH
ncbi:hypothetical protein [Massilia sp. SYSU DXS3249]